MNEEDNVLINHTSDLNGAYCTNGTSVTHTSDGIEESRVVVVVFMFFVVLGRVCLVSSPDRMSFVKVHLRVVGSLYKCAVCCGNKIKVR